MIGQAVIDDNNEGQLSASAQCFESVAGIPDLIHQRQVDGSDRRRQLIGDAYTGRVETAAAIVIGNCHCDQILALNGIRVARNTSTIADYTIADGAISPVYITELGVINARIGNCSAQFDIIAYPEYGIADQPIQGNHWRAVVDGDRSCV